MRFRGNADHELPAVGTIRHWFRYSLIIGFHVCNAVGHQLTNTGEGSLLAVRKPTQRRKLSTEPDKFFVFRRPGNSICVMVDHHSASYVRGNAGSVCLYPEARARRGTQTSSDDSIQANETAQEMDQGLWYNPLPLPPSRLQQLAEHPQVVFQLLRELVLARVSQHQQQAELRP